MIRELCEAHGIPCVFTSKLFFKRLTTSVTIAFPEKERAAYEAQCVAIRNKFGNPSGGKQYFNMLDELKVCDNAYMVKRNAFVSSLVRTFPKCLTNSEYRINKVSATFYCDDPTLMIDVIRAREIHVVKVTVPRNEAEIAFLRANTDKMVRDRYFLETYPYKITFTPQVGKTVTEYVTTQLADNGIVDRTRAYYEPTNSVPTLFLSDFTDLFLAQVGLSENITTVEEVVLRT